VLLGKFCFYFSNQKKILIILEKTKYHPPLHKDINEIYKVLININIMTKKNEIFLLINNKETNIIIFTCLTNLKYL